MDFFVNVKKMINYLSGIYDNAFKQRDAETSLNQLQMKPFQSFFNYYLKFLKLVQNAYIPFNKHFITYLYDFFYLFFKNRAIYKFTPNNNFQDFVFIVNFLDKEVYRI